jgi:hypothetical protein
MNLAQVEKLYTKLSPDELAALAFAANVRGDHDEFETILASVGRRTYSCLDQRFSRLTNAYLDLALFYGMTYWKNRTFLAYAETLSAVKGDDKSKALLSHLLDNAIAMDVALQEVCAKVNIDYMAVKKLAICVDEYSPEKCADSELVQDYVALFNKFIT